MISRAPFFSAVALLCVTCGSAIKPGSSGHKVLDDNDGTPPLHLGESDADVSGGRRGGIQATGSFEVNIAGSNRAGNDEEDEEEALGDIVSKSAPKNPVFSAFGGATCSKGDGGLVSSKPSPIDKWIQISGPIHDPLGPEIIYLKTNSRQVVYTCFCGKAVNVAMHDAGGRCTRAKIDLDKETAEERRKRLIAYCDKKAKYKKQTDGTKKLIAGTVGGHFGMGLKVAQVGECFQKCLHLVFWKSVETARYPGLSKAYPLAHKFTKADLKVPAPEKWSFNAVTKLGKRNRNFIRAIGCMNFMYSHHKFKGFPGKAKAVFWPLFNSGCTQKEFDAGTCKKYLKWAEECTSAGKFTGDAKCKKYMNSSEKKAKKAQEEAQKISEKLRKKKAKEKATKKAKEAKKKAKKKAKKGKKKKAIKKLRKKAVKKALKATNQAKRADNRVLKNASKKP